MHVTLPRWTRHHEVLPNTLWFPLPRQTKTAGKTWSLHLHHQHIAVDGGNLFWWLIHFDSPVEKSLLEAPAEALKLPPAKMDKRNTSSSQPEKTKY